MEIQSLTLKNFRQFEDAHIEFARGDDGVTVIHGQNGSGKTTLLRAFPWILYGEVAFENGVEHLPNEGVMADASPNERVRVTGELTFNHEGTIYRAKRWTEFRKPEEDAVHGVVEDEGIELEADDGSGPREINNPETRLKQILPKRLRELFFFDGEDIDELAEMGNEDKIQEAIQNIMGLTILERSISHLEDVEKEFENEMEEYGSDELRELIDKKRNLQAKIEEHDQEIDTQEQNKEQLKGEIADIRANLEEFEESRELEQERTRLENEREKIEQRIDDINDEIRETISESAYLEFAMPAIRETAEELDDLRANGEIPSELTNEFVDRLLNQGECICKRPLEEGTEPYEAVESWKSSVTVEGIDQAAVRLIAHLEQISEGRSDLFNELNDLISTRSDLEDEVESLNESIDEIGSNLGELGEDRDHEEPAALERRRQEKEEELEEVKERIIRLEQRIEDKETEIEELEGRIDEAEEEQGQALTARRRKQAAAEVRKELEASFQELQSTVREWSDNLVKDTFGKIASKELEAEITDDFKLKIRQRVGDEMIEVNKSTGERQIASLAFIGSLVSIARQRYESDDDSPFFTGGIYPVVMDSPFGALDKSHRRQVGRLMPELADQVIVFATDSQWEGPVAEEMSPHISRQYWLNFDSGSDGGYPATEIKREQIAVAEGE